MSSKDRKTISSLVGLVFFILCYFLLWTVLELHVYLFLSISIFGAVIVSQLTYNLLPAKKEKQNKMHKKSPSKQTKASKLTDKELLTTNIDKMSGSDFERLLALYFKDKGYNPKIIGGSGDHGVDIVMKDPKDGLQIAVQCKRYKKGNNVGNADIIKLEGGKRFYKCPATWFITTSNYTKKAIEYAERTNTKIWNGLHVQQFIEPWRKEKLKSLNS